MEYEDLDLLLLDTMRRAKRSFHKRPISSPDSQPQDVNEKKYRPAPPALLGSPGSPAFQRMIILDIIESRHLSRPKDIASEIHVSPSTLSEMIKKLEEDGLLERRPDNRDRRSLILTPTESGRKLAKQVYEWQTNTARYAFINLEDDDKRELIRLINKAMGKKTGSAGGSEK